MAQRNIVYRRMAKLLQSMCQCKVLHKCCSWPLRRGKSPESQELGKMTAKGSYLLPKQTEFDKHCMIIDLDETLVHSTFEPIKNPDFVIPVEINGTIQKIYVLKRPYVDQFLEKVGPLFECVLFTASLGIYAEKLANLLDKSNTFKARLYRESCVFEQGCYIKDLSQLGRSLERVVIIDNSPASYLFHPDNAVPVSSWFDDKTDMQLLQMIPFLERLAKVDNVYSLLRNSSHPLNDSSKKVNLSKNFMHSAPTE